MLNAHFINLFKQNHAMVTYCGALGWCGVSGGGQLARADLTVGIKQMCAVSLCCIG